jgi:hypothetical protein
MVVIYRRVGFSCLVETVGVTFFFYKDRNVNTRILIGRVEKLGNNAWSCLPNFKLWIAN